MYVILTSKPGQYRTEAGADIALLEAWDYILCGRVRAHFEIGRLHRETRVRVVEEDGSGTVNWVPSKFLERFDSYDAARRELDQLCAFGGLDARLQAADLAAAPSDINRP
ncbi:MULTISPECIES: hypothetical protein [Bordetella]|uniref:Uncharacterized protein n=1 Tax=Bordetella genomosp. 2 TaxID=1983456 RepID=A0A261VSA9_9BORD|nr:MULTISPECIES: hypothetical protein [Bordetella]OZI76671.1 hypothetical protein CAL24_16350 [Bordetella genomosp. 2]